MGSPLKIRMLVLMVSMGVVWGVSGFALVFDNETVISQLALIPRRLDSLAGIVGMPFVHGSWPHLMANTMPLLVLGGILLFRGGRYFAAVTFSITVLGGMLLWCFGRDAAHIGASGVVFGSFGFLITRGLYERSWQSISIAALVIFLYGGMIWGVLPREDGVSWEAHLYGLLAGVVVARVAFAMGRNRDATVSSGRFNP